MKIAIAFYGITRSLKYTSESIYANIIEPARAAGEVKVYCHFFSQDSINNPRTGEVGPLDADEWKLLKPDVSLVEELGIDQAEDALFRQLIPYGNAWEDDGQSIRNILRQLVSLKKVTQLVQNDGGADMIIFARPDMLYHDLFPLREWLKSIGQQTVMLPYWQWSGGLNDRFAICGRLAYLTYGYRIDRAVDFCRNLRRPIHSERLLMYALAHSQIQLATFSLRATRIRSNGEHANEGFGRVKIAKRIEAYLLCNLYTRINAIFGFFRNRNRDSYAVKI